MKSFASVSLLSALLALSACASQPQSAEEEDAKLRLTPDAARVVNEKGEVEAAKAGTEESKKSDLVCERVKRTGSHMTETYCYSRREAERNRAKLEQELDRAKQGGIRGGDN